MKIFAIDLKEYDKIIIPGTGKRKRREFRVIGNPECGELMVNGFAYPIKDGVTLGKKTPIQFALTVELEVERP